tara:strand:+ start:286 stop:567 length:282 start_codon:yes stop_codon:yes gene_type:complete
MKQPMRKIKVETMIPTNFKWIARDQDGSLHIFEKQPNLDYGTNANPLACDMWDVYEGETMQITPKTAVSAGLYQDELGDWRDSCKELLTMYEK